MSDHSPTPILEVLDVLPMVSVTGLGHAPLSLRIMAGDCVLIEAQDRSQAAQFSDLCCGLLPLRQGSIRFYGSDWEGMPHERAAAMRGQIGRVDGQALWIGFLGIDANILLPQLHHTRRSEQELRNAAAELSCGFGLPGLPIGRPDSLTSTDLVRAACVRAFLGQPRLLILNSAELERLDDLVPSLVQALTAAHDRHAASIWLTHTKLIWNDRALPTTVRLRLTESGLVPAEQLA